MGYLACEKERGGRHRKDQRGKGSTGRVKRRICILAASRRGDIKDKGKKMIS